MGVPAGQIVAAFAELADGLAAALGADGWRRLPTRAPFTTSGVAVACVRALGDEGCCAAVEVYATARRRLCGWSGLLSLEYGVGHEAATGLMPFVGLEPRAVLLDGVDPAHDVSAAPVGIALADADQVPRLTGRLVELIGHVDWSFAERRSGLDALDAALADEDLAGVEDAIRFRPLIRAATGRHEEARALLDQYLGGDRREARQPDYRWFAEALSRRLDAGEPAPPSA